MKKAIENFQNKTVVWLDDIRNPWEISYHKRNPFLNSIHTVNDLSLEENGYKIYEIVWVRSYQEFTSYIMSQKQLPHIISFDHDLADEHYTPKEYWEDYEASKKYQEEKSKNYKEKTGYDCALFLVELCMAKNKSIPEYNVHSANPVGADNIRHYLENAKKHI